MVVCGRCGHANREGAKFCEECGFSLADGPTSTRERRKTVTVLFCDLAGSTAFGEMVDPERLRVLLARYFDEMKSIIERHGGSVEKFIGDAVMAVFGAPVSREDDALRAVRSAVEMRDALPALGLEGRIGVMTGKVVTGTAERLATGDAVNVAARLEQAAEPGEVLIGEPTLALVRDATEVEAVAPLELKGKAAPQRAYRLVRVLDVPGRRHETSFVGRERELAFLRAAWDRVQVGQRCELVTLVGDAGVGKSRLAAELLTSLDARLVSGRCLPYGEGISYWPVIEVVKQLGVLPENDVAAAAIRSLIGETKEPASAEEIAWAFRKTLERAAAERPLVILFEDIHWGEETFLDLLEHVALLSSGAPFLLLCLARPELVERRAGWPVSLRLEPLPEEEVLELISDAPPELRDQIARAAGGNPLFIAEMLAIARDADENVVVPPTLQALLDARLDQLESAERSVLERGAIEGEIFHRGAVQALATPEAHVTPRLAALVRKDLIRPYPPQLVGEDGFRFRHLLVRDAAYRAMPKAVRAELHQRFAVWLEERGVELVEVEELLGYHLEQACRYRAEVALPEDGAVAVAARQHLAAAGRRALFRGNSNTAASLLERAAALTPPGELDVALEVDLTQAFFWAGESGAGLRRAASLAERGAAIGDRLAELCGKITEATLRGYLEPEGATEQLAELVELAIPEFEAAEDDLALYVAFSALGQVMLMRARFDDMLAAYERAFVHAQRAGLVHNLLGWRAAARHYGTTPVAEVLAWLEEQETHGVRDLYLGKYKTESLAMLGRFDEARELITAARVQLEELGASAPLARMTGQFTPFVDLLAGDPVAAVERAEQGCALLEELGEKSFLSTAYGELAYALFAAGRLEEAESWAGRAAELGGKEDAVTQMLWRQVRAKVLAHRGDEHDGERLAREAVTIGDATDLIDAQGDAYADLAEVLLLRGKTDEAADALGQALDRYERKGNVVSAERTRRRLAELEHAALQ